MQYTVKPLEFDIEKITLKDAIREMMVDELPTTIVLSMGETIPHTYRLGDREEQQNILREVYENLDSFMIEDIPSGSTHHYTEYYNLQEDRPDTFLGLLRWIEERTNSSRYRTKVYSTGSSEDSLGYLMASIRILAAYENMDDSNELDYIVTHSETYPFISPVDYEPTLDTQEVLAIDNFVAKIKEFRGIHPDCDVDVMLNIAQGRILYKRKLQALEDHSYGMKYCEDYKPLIEALKGLHRESDKIGMRTKQGVVTMPGNVSISNYTRASLSINLEASPHVLPTPTSLIGAKSKSSIYNRHKRQLQTMLEKGTEILKSGSFHKPKKHEENTLKTIYFFMDLAANHKVTERIEYAKTRTKFPHQYDPSIGVKSVLDANLDYLQALASMFNIKPLPADPKYILDQQVQKVQQPDTSIPVEDIHV